MKSSRSSQRHGLTLIEVLVVLAILIILVGLIGPPPPSARGKAKQLACLNNLKNIGQALHAFSTAHGSEFPMALSITNGGTREWLSDETQLWRHWRTLSNELGSATILSCPSDSERPPARSWHQLTNNSHLSYFLALNPRPDEPQSILAGDRNVTTNGVLFGPGRLTPSSNLRLGFSTKPRRYVGNVLLVDGSVQPISSPRVNEAWVNSATNSGHSTNVWLVP